MESEKIIIKCASFGLNSNGEPDIFFGRFEMTQEDIDVGNHLVLMKKLTDSDGHDGFLFCDENDPAGAVMQLCEWATYPVLDSKLNPITS